MKKPVIATSDRAKIRNLAGYLQELEFLETLEGGTVTSFTVIVKKKDNFPEEFGMKVSNDLAVDQLRKSFFAEKIQSMIEEYRQKVESTLINLQG